MSVDMRTEPPPVLAAALWPAQGQARWLRAAVLIVLGSLFMAACAKVQVPMWPVPMTMQTFGVLFIGAAYGWRLGGAAVLAYLAQGLVGLPVFAGAVAGPAYLVGPTGGFLVGFVLAAWATGWMVENGWDRPLWRLAAALAVGTVIPFVPGLVWLAYFWANAEGTVLGLQAALAAGLTPFIPGAILKLALAAALLTAGRRVAATPRG